MWSRVLVQCSCLSIPEPPTTTTDGLEQKLHLALLNVATSARLCSLNNVDLGGALEATFDVFGAPGMLLRMLDWSVLVPVYKEGEASSSKGMRSRKKKVDLIARDKRGQTELLFVEVKPSVAGSQSDLLKLQKLCKDAFDSRFSRTPHHQKTALVQSFAVYGMLVVGLRVELYSLHRSFSAGYSFGLEAEFSVPLKLDSRGDLQKLFHVVCAVAALTGRLAAHCISTNSSSSPALDTGNGGGRDDDDAHNDDDHGDDDSSNVNGPGGGKWHGAHVPPTNPTPKKPSGKGTESKGRKRHQSESPPWIAAERSPRAKFKRDIVAMPTRRDTCSIELVFLENRPCVLKVYDLRSSWKLVLANAELQVLLAAQRLRLPHVVRLVEVFVDHSYGSQLVFVLPRLQRVDLRFARNTTSVAAGLKKLQLSFTQLLRGLAGLHRAGFAHGDVAPRNIMLDADSGSLVWIDFGLSRCVPECKHRPDCGTSGFIAPDSPADCVSGTEPDIWALGCLLGRALADVVANLPVKDAPKWSTMRSVLARTDQDELPLLTSLLASVGPAETPDEKAVVSGICLVAKMTDPDVAQRITATKALEDVFFAPVDAPTKSPCPLMQPLLPLRRLDNQSTL
jgi:serine/threonine protein kinase